jgi:hypothetical protein
MRLKKLLSISGILLFITGMSSAAFGQNNNLTGTWSLNDVKLIKYIEETQDSTEITYDNQVQNSVSGIFDFLTFEKDSCSTIMDEVPVKSSYISDKNSLTLYYLMVPFSYQMKRNQNKIILSRKFYGVNSKNEVTHYKVTLNYLKQK